MLSVIISRPQTATEGLKSLEEKLLKAVSGRDDLRAVVSPSLYDLPPESDAVQALRKLEEPLVVCAYLNPRAAFWVLHANGITGRMGSSPLIREEMDEQPRSDLPDRKIWCFDLREHLRPTRLLNEIERLLALVEGGPVEPLATTSATTPSTGANGHITLDGLQGRRWYPVIDKSRCTGCLECLNFCLFGVYGIDHAGQLFVETPDACKDGCPACSRVCPRGAIMFPMHDNPGIAGAGATEAGQSGLPQITKRPPRDDLDNLVDGLDDAEL